MGLLIGYSGIPIQISVYDDKMYIANDGKLPDNWTLEEFLGKHRSSPFNPLIAHVFYLAGYIESWGRGIEKIFAACESDGIYPPKYTVHPRDIMVKLSAPEERVIRSGKRIVTKGFTERFTERFTEKVTERELAVIEIIADNENITTTEVSKKLGKSRTTVSKIIKSLKERGIIERIGSDRKGQWKLNLDA